MGNIPKKKYFDGKILKINKKFRIDSKNPKQILKIN